MQSLDTYFFYKHFWTKACPEGIGTNGTHRSHARCHSSYDQCFRGSRQKFAQVDLVFVKSFLVVTLYQGLHCQCRSQQDSMNARKEKVPRFSTPTACPLCRSRAWSSKLYHCTEQNCCALPCHPKVLASTLHNIS